MSLIPGRIVYSIDAIPDPQGQNPKPGRKFVVVATKAEISSGDPLFVVAITSEINGGNDEVNLSWGPKCRSGLTMPSVALCSWTENIDPTRMDVSKHHVMPTELKQIFLKSRPECEHDG